MILRVLLASVMLSWSAPALAEDAATACVRTKVWEARQRGWSVRAIQSAALTPGQLRAWPIAVAPGLSYQVLTCGEEGVLDLDVLLVDGNGNIVERASGGREPSLTHDAERASRLHLVVRPSRAQDAEPRHTAIALLFR